MGKRTEAESCFELVAPYLEENGVNSLILQGMKLYATGSGNIRVRTEGFGGLVLLRKGRELSPNGGAFPDEWIGSAPEWLDIERLLTSHPQRDLVKSVSCITHAKGCTICIFPKDGIKFKLAQFIRKPPQFSNSVYDWFPKEDLIVGPGGALCKEAAALIADAYQRQREEFKGLTIPDKFFGRQKLSLFRTDQGGSIAGTIKAKKTGGLFEFKWNGFSVRYGIASDTFSEIVSTYDGCLEAVTKSQKAILQAKSLCAEFKKSEKWINASYDLKLLPLRTVVSVPFHNFTSNYEISNRAFKKDAEAALNAFKADLAKDQEADRRLREKYEQEVSRSRACGSLLADCIIDTVRVNTKSYKGISFDALVKKVRGLATYYYEDGENAGCFKLIPSDDVENMVRVLMRLGIIDTMRVSGEYAVYDKYFLADGEKARFLTDVALPASGMGDKGWLKEVRNPSGEYDWQRKLELLDYPAVYCVDKGSFVKYFSSAPEDVLTYIRMFSKMGDGTKKKLCKQLMAELDALR